MQLARRPGLRDLPYSQRECVCERGGGLTARTFRSILGRRFRTYSVRTRADCRQRLLPLSTTSPSLPVPGAVSRRPRSLTRARDDLIRSNRGQCSGKTLPRKRIRGELVLDARGAVEHHCPSVKDEGDLRPRRRAGRSPKEGDRSSTVAESGRTGCGSSRGTRSRSGSREEVTQRSCLASPDGGVRWLFLGQQRSTRCAREARAQTV